MRGNNNAYQNYRTLGSSAAEKPVEIQQEKPSSVISITSFEQRNNIINDTSKTGKRLTIIDNYTPWCGPCKVIEPKFENLAAKENFAKVVNFCKENAESGIPGGKPVSGVPCFHFYFDGKFMDKLTVHGADFEALYTNMMLFFKVDDPPLPVANTETPVNNSDIKEVQSVENK